MLSYIHIKNIAIIDELEVDFNKGLNVLTGETGVGKSIIINAINFTLGARTSKDLIRKGASQASCEMIFDLNEENVKQILELENIEMEDNQIIISRTLNDSGKNIFKINGTVVSSGVMREITSKIIDIHGQHEHQSLFDVSKHIDILDRFDKKDIFKLKDDLKEKYDEYKKINSKIESLLGNNGDRERRIDILQFQIDEIENAKLIPGEDEDLEARRSVMLNADKISQGTANTHDFLDIADENISKALKELERLSRLDPKFEEMNESLMEASAIVSDTKGSVSDFIDEFSFNPNEQEQVEERLDLIDKLKRKYGNDIELILEYMEDRQNELDEIVNGEEILNELKDKRSKIEKEILTLCDKLTKLRTKASEDVTKKIEGNLKDLEMKNAKFEIKISPKETFTEKGMDDVEFLFSSNLGEEVKPLDKIASGGEISRVMLAIKDVLSENDEIQILVFDEIDTGISGRAAQAVAEKMMHLAREHQILCITHLPQIAAMADFHYEISKAEKEGRTISSIKLLNEEEDINEIARLVTGAEMTDTARQHAKELKMQANKIKG
ncbi:MAG: DNA repair protein RecN [Clostridia bacterium]|nr:DNA repair protein RecN [Clostridia bacterium]